MAQKRGIAVISEVTLTAGILVIAVVTFLITGNVTESEGETFSREQQNELLTDLTDRLERVALENQAFTSLVYNPPVRQYKIVVENSSVLTVKIPGVDRGRTQLQSVTVQNTVLQDDNTLCISGSSGEAEITAGACSRIDMATFCANGRCAGNNQCDKERGETCNVDDCSCPSSAGTAEANTTCQPSYIPESYIEGSGDTVDPGCVVDGRTWVQDEEQRCDFDFECKKNLQCSKTVDANRKHCCPSDETWDGTECKDFNRGPGERCSSSTVCQDPLTCNEPDPSFSGSGDRCCPAGKNWNGTQCKGNDEGEVCTPDDICRDDLNCNPTQSGSGDNRCCPDGQQWDGDRCTDPPGPTFDVAFVPILFDDSEADEFTGIVNSSFDFFKQMEPWKSCSPSPDNNVEKHWVSAPYDGSCDLNSCAASSSTGVSPGCFNAVRQCAESQFDDIQRIIGVCNNEDGQCGVSGLCGQANGIGARTVMTFEPCVPSRPSATDIDKTVVHELGHALDFYHLNADPPNYGSCRFAAGACRGVNADDCTLSNDQIVNFHMTYCPARNQWGPAAASYLTNQKLDQYLWGSCSS